jgi:NADPH-dependent 2,4-dienoyl-CoA reductase/sulfur reductase-like enzyme
MAEPVLRVDVAVVGAGPAGVAAALAAAGRGRRVCLLDEGFRPGGQIWRHRAGEAPPAAQALLKALAGCGAQVLAGVSVFDGWRQEDVWHLAASGRCGRIDLEAQALVLACGARELFAPFPGWTLPGVLGAGGGQALLKEGLELNGETVLVAGSGPLLLPAAASARKHGGRLLAVLEQTAWGKLLGMAPLLAARPGKAVQAMSLGWALRGTPYRPGWWVAEALGSDRLEHVRITDGRRELLLDCRWLFCGFGLVPNLELGRLLGCAVASGAITVDGSQLSSVAGIYAAGEVCGVAGVDAALAEGRIAGLAAAGAWAPGSWAGLGFTRARSRARAMGRRLEELFALRADVLALPRPDTLVCRCEDVPFGAIDPAWGARETKLCTRAGMGPCQGRVCGPILARRFGHELDTVRIPIKGVPLGQLMVDQDDTGSPASSP